LEEARSSCFFVGAGGRNWGQRKESPFLTASSPGYVVRLPHLHQNDRPVTFTQCRNVLNFRVLRHSICCRLSSSFTECRWCRVKDGVRRVPRG
jgi:hypothetical protein